MAILGDCVILIWLVVVGYVVDLFGVLSFTCLVWSHSPSHTWSHSPSHNWSHSPHITSHILPHITGHIPPHITGHIPLT